MIILMDQSFTRLAELQPSYMQWKRKYYRPDEFTFTVALNDYCANKNYVIYGDRVGLITRRVKSKDFVTIHGFEYGIPFKRVADSDTQTEVAETLQKYYITTNCITPLSRKILHLKVAHDQERGSVLTYPARFQKLEDILSEIYFRTGLGWEVTYKHEEFTFDTIEGKDRTTGQSILPPVIFAEKYGNLFNVEVTESLENYYTVAVMGGQGLGGARTIEYVGSATQNNRFEIFVDAKDLDTTAKLQAKGQEVLTEYGETVSIKAEFKSTSAFEYGTDYNLGDVVTVIHDDYTLNLRLIEVHETKDREDSLEFIFGQEPLTQALMINKKISLMNSEVRV